MRASGVLLPISSIPSNYGIGCFSKEAYNVVDQLIAAGQKYWQILPLGPTGYGDSPYQSFSTFAGNPYFIDLEVLIREGLLTEQECRSCDWGGSESYVDYGKIYESRFKLLRMAYNRFDCTADPEFGKFVRANGYWLEDYCLFMAIKNEQGGKGWTEWPAELMKRLPGAIAQARERLHDEIQFYRFQQYWFYKQWCWLKTYANNNGLKIIGDVPIYVAFDSADAWANPLLFQFDEDSRPLAVAGCPPDGFSATGQLWGNPLYNWEVHKQSGFEWWIRRIRHCFTMYDIVRIDHFRGFDEYYAIPFGDKTAENGWWEKGPGMELFNAIKNRLGERDIIAEDLGFMTDTVVKLVEDSGYPNMKVIEFAFDERDTGNSSDYLPHNYPNNCVVYTGTHDNETLSGWFKDITPKERRMVRQYLNNFHTSDDEIYKDIICLVMSSVASLCVIPMQDYLGLDNSARINQPSTLGKNWKWRLKEGQFDSQIQKEMRELAVRYGRCEPVYEPEEEETEAEEMKEEAVPNAGIDEKAGEKK